MLGLYAERAPSNARKLMSRDKQVVEAPTAWGTIARRAKPYQQASAPAAPDTDLAPVEVSVNLPQVSLSWSRIGVATASKAVPLVFARVIL